MPASDFTQRPIEDLALGQRCYNRLKPAGVHLIGDIFTQSDEFLRPDFEEIRAALKRIASKPLSAYGTSWE